MRILAIVILPAFIVCSSQGEVLKTVGKSMVQDIQVVAANSKGFYNAGNNRTYLRFATSEGLIPVQPQRMKLYMPQMGSMPYMESIITEFQQKAPGVYYGEFFLEMGDTWHCEVDFIHEENEYQARFSIVARR